MLHLVSPNVFPPPLCHLKVSTAGKPIYYVSAKRDFFTPMKLPKYTLPKVTRHCTAHADQSDHYTCLILAVTPCDIRRKSVQTRFSLWNTRAFSSVGYVG